MKIRVLCSCLLLTLSMTGALLAAAPLAWALSGYEVRFEFSDGADLEDDLRKGATTIQLKDRPPPTLYLLKQRAAKDVSNLTDIIMAQGYFKPDVSSRIRAEADNRAEVVFSVSPGPRYEVHSVQIDVQPPERRQALNLPSPEDLKLRPGSPALAQAVRSARQSLTRHVVQQGYVYAAQDKPVLLLDHERRGVEITFTLHPGPLADFGETRLQGLEHVEPDYVLAKTGWSPGDTYDPAKIQAFKERLLETGLFSLVQVTHPDSLNSQGRLPLTVELKERKRHSISLGIGYDTDVGPNLSASWEDRNFAGKGEQLRYELYLSEPLQEVKARYRQPVFFRNDQSLILQSTLSNEDTEAYTSTGGELSLNVERSLNPANTVSAGIAYRGASVEDAESSDFFHLVSLPLSFDHDTRDNILDPKKGRRINLRLTPYQEMAQARNQFVEARLSGWRYIGVADATVLALRGQIGSLAGAETEDIPADVRFFAGGGGSIRGYPYQEVGPRRDSDPFGGRSLVECSVELRHKFTQRFGSAVFLDGGNVYDDPVPDFAPSLRWGAGAGLRYYTAVGPLRLDVAFPLNKDPDHHDDFQVYISLGQAF